MYNEFNIDCEEFRYKNGTLSISISNEKYAAVWEQIIGQLMEHQSDAIADAMVDESPLMACDLLIKIALELSNKGIIPDIEPYEHEAKTVIKLGNWLKSNSIKKTA